MQRRGRFHLLTYYLEIDSRSKIEEGNNLRRSSIGTRKIGVSILQLILTVFDEFYPSYDEATSSTSLAYLK